jgi:protein AATF/BFR2
VSVIFSPNVVKWLIKMLGLTLAEQIAQLDDTAPLDVDIERLEGGLGEDGDGENEGDLSAGRSHYLDVGCVQREDCSIIVCSHYSRMSSLRKQRDALVDPKYEGVRTSRSQLYEFDNGSDDGMDDPAMVSGSDSETSSQTAEHEGKCLQRCLLLTGLTWLDRRRKAYT